MLDAVFLTFEQVVAIHDDQIERWGGSHGIRNLSLLEAAVMRPQTTFGGRDLYPSLFDKAAALMHSLIMNHAFLDGNKRTGVVSALAFLELNGYWLEVDQKELYNTAVNIETKRWNLGKISSWLKKRSTKIS